MKDERVEAMAVFARPNSCEGVGAILAVAPLVILSAFILPTSSFLLHPSAFRLHPYLMTPRPEVRINSSKKSTSVESLISSSIFSRACEVLSLEERRR